MYIKMNKNNQGISNTEECMSITPKSNITWCLRFSLQWLQRIVHIQMGYHVA